MNVFFAFLAVVFLVLNGIFNGAETGFVCLDPNRISLAGKGTEDARIRRLLAIARAPERFLALTLIGINLCLVLATSLVTTLLEPFGTLAGSVGTAALGIFIFMVCELVPKLAFSERPLQCLRRVLPILSLSDWLFSLPVSFVTRITRFFVEAFGKREDRNRALSREELLILLSRGVSAGVVAERPLLMVKGIFGLRERLVMEIMVPRTQIKGVSISATPQEAMDVILASGCSRIPVYEGSIDQVIGVIYFKDLFLHGATIASLREIAAKPVFVPGVKKAYELFREMRQQRQNMALILDEFGAVSGLVTLEDLIEEVVGEIHDEFDQALTGLRRHEDGSISVRATLTLVDFQRETGISLPAPDDVTTINGLILTTLGRIPTTGETIIIGKYKLLILEAQDVKVGMVRVYPYG